MPHMYTSTPKLPGQAWTVQLLSRRHSPPRARFPPEAFSSDTPLTLDLVISPDNLLGSQLFLFAPLTVGGSLFFFSNLILLVWLQKRWFSPEPSTAAWQAAFWSTLGSLNFALIGISLFLNDLMGSSLAGFIGSTAFLLGSIIQWYDVMAFHPDSWAT